MKTKHITNSRLAKLFLPKDVVAITLWRWVFYKKQTPDIRTVAHELVHIDQIKAHGFFRFYLSYLLYYLAERARGRDHFTSYMAIDYEVVARQLSMTKQYERRAEKLDL